MELKVKYSSRFKRDCVLRLKEAWIYLYWRKLLRNLEQESHWM